MQGMANNCYAPVEGVVNQVRLGAGCEAPIHRTVVKADEVLVLYMHTDHGGVSQCH